MRRFMERIHSNEKGFTLIELIIVIAILAIIAAIAIPNILNAIDNSRKTTDVSNAKIIATTVASVIAKNDSYASTTGMYNVGTGAGAGFATQVNTDLGTAPTPKYKGAETWAENKFFYTVSTTGIVTVYVTDAAVTESTAAAPTLPTNNSQVYPITGTKYTNN